MTAIDLKYLKKRAEMTRDFNDEKVQAALSKIIPPKLYIAESFDLENNGYECVIPNKLFRNWIDLIPEQDRGFFRFTYSGGDEAALEKYLGLAMTKPAFKTFQSLVSKDAGDSDLFLMRWLIWHFAILGQPVGFDFGSYEMNVIFGSLPVDISKDKIKFGRELSLVDFYRQIKFAEWGIGASN